MNHAIRSIRAYPAAVFPSSPKQLGQTTSGAKFRQITMASKPESQPSKEASKKADDKSGDVMSNSFGEGYATRSDEEGFGGVYGGNQMEKELHEEHHAYDKQQGSEVKEKEKGRHQTNAEG
ncbi:hypothetical protein Tsubulata_014121 [Turnera subulata]|uniref:Uncharacterized protein n=1 Tax=Turnera subulata TaxID=218843 RepID=A0A9Q0GMX8_9ROSI|nr:hypothetical protein Tsubulata_014121 [Turnera subulata]